MKKLVLETTAPFQGLPELVADRGGPVREGRPADRMGRARERRQEHRTSTSTARRGSTRSPATARCSSRARPTCTTPANGATTAASRTPRSAAARSGGAASSPTPPSWCGRIRRCSPRSSWPARRSACRSTSARIISRCICSKASCRARTSSSAAPRTARGQRFDAMMRGEIEATTLTEPYVTLAEKKGCRTICEAFYHGTEVASDRVDAETYGAFNRAVREAVKRINADKAKYLHYFIDYHAKKDAEIARAHAAGPAREPHRGVRSGADPARRDAAHLRLAQELGHAGADRDAAGAGQSPGPAARRTRSRRSRACSSGCHGSELRACARLGMTNCLLLPSGVAVGKSPGTDDGNGDGRGAIGVTAGPGASSAAARSARRCAAAAWSSPAGASAWLGLAAGFLRRATLSRRDLLPARRSGTLLRLSRLSSSPCASSP